MLHELPFYDELNVVKTTKAFRRYARSYSIEIIKDKNRNMNDSLVQLEASKPVIREFVNWNQRFWISNNTKGFIKETKRN